MKITITGKQINVGPKLREYVEDNLQQTISKYFDSTMGASVAFSREGQNLKVDLSVHPTRGILLQGTGEGGDAHGAFDVANEKIAKRLRRYKKRLRDKKGRDANSELAQISVLERDDITLEELPEEENGPITIAEVEADIPHCSVSGAVMRMDLADVPAILFRNSAHGGLNMVYRRNDGNIGWVDPKVQEK